MPPKSIDYNATVIHADYMSDSLAVFRVKPDGPVASFVPGQYAVLGLNHEEKGAVLRAYSIASPPHLHHEYFEYYVRFVANPTSDNPLTHLLFKKNAGDRIHMRERLKGKFTIPNTVGEEDTRLRVCIAAGTGLAPFTSMVFQHQHDHGVPGNYAIIHGASYPWDLGYRGQLEEVMNSGPQKRYFPTISRPKEVPEWKGLVGRAESHFTPERLPLLEGAMGMSEGEMNPGNCVALICGLQGTIATAAVALMRRGFVPEDRKTRIALGIPAEVKPSLFWEQYDTTPILDLKNPELVAELKGFLLNSGVPLAESAV